MSLKIHHLDTKYIHQVWSMVDHWLIPVFEKSVLSKYYSIDNLKEYIIRGEQMLLVFVDDDGVLPGALTVQWDSHPKAKIANVTSFGGMFGYSSEHYNLFIDFCKAMGATRIECSCRPSVARLLKHKMGFTPSTHIHLELEI